MPFHIPLIVLGAKPNVMSYRPFIDAGKERVIDCMSEGTEGARLYLLRSLSSLLA